MKLLQLGVLVAKIAKRSSIEIVGMVAEGLTLICRFEIIYSGLQLFPLISRGKCRDESSKPSNDYFCSCHAIVRSLGDPFLFLFAFFGNLSSDVRPPSDSRLSSDFGR